MVVAVPYTPRIYMAPDSYKNSEGYRAQISKLRLHSGSRQSINLQHSASSAYRANMVPLPVVIVAILVASADVTCSQNISSFSKQPTVIRGYNGTCPLQEVTEQSRQSIINELRNILPCRYILIIKINKPISNMIS